MSFLFTPDLLCSSGILGCHSYLCLHVNYLEFSCILERFSIECRKTNTNVVTSTNQSRCKQGNEPIQMRSKFRVTFFKAQSQSEGKIAHARHDCFWFSFPLVD